jgi:inosine/xanthosine triphosphate pyrophosphatase family protein
MSKLVLASKNTGKIAELERLLSNLAADIKILGLADFPDLPQVDLENQLDLESLYQQLDYLVI